MGGAYLAEAWGWVMASSHLLHLGIRVPGFPLPAGRSSRRPSLRNFLSNCAGAAV